MKKNSLFLLLLIITCAQLNAQEFRTDESVSKQLKNNTQPGLKYGQASNPATRSSKGFSGSSLAKEINEGKHGPLQAGPSTSAPAARSGNEEASAAGTLPSSRSAADLAREVKAAKVEAPKLPPVQEEKTEVPVKAKPAPVKKVQQ